MATDIIVLIDFYEKDRMIFFGISLAILILAQCSYSIACSLRFDTVMDWDAWKAALLFCCLLPFGSFVAFFMYMASGDGDEAKFKWFKRFIDNIGLSTDTPYLFQNDNDDSDLIKWIKTKLDKHLGFILEAAIEAFPQSLLQIIAIVYYQEANYISIISILLSMVSVMSKSLVLSQGIDRATFIWSWLCVVTDFFGIFFTLTWVFYSNNNIEGNFLGYFSIFGEIWFWKFAISTLFPVGLVSSLFFVVGLWVTYFAFLCIDGFVAGSLIARCGWSCFWLFLGIYFVFCLL